jgi:hypothetical protein
MLLLKKESIGSSDALGSAMDRLSPESVEIVLRLVVATLAGIGIGLNRFCRTSPSACARSGSSD